MVTVNALMARHAVVVPARDRDEYESEMQGVIETQVAQFGDTPEAARRISVIARSRAISLYRAGNAQKEKKMKSLNRVLDSGADFIAPCGEPGEELEIAEIVAKIDSHLTEDELKMVRLFRDGCTQDEVAKTLNLPVMTTSDRWNKLQAKMKCLMERYA